MKIYKKGDKSKAICESCKKIVPTTFDTRSVPLSSGKGSVDDILCATCDHCGMVVSIPQQSAPRIRESIRKERKPIEVRLPRHLLDILYLAGDKFKLGDPERLKDSIIRYYIGLASTNNKMVKNIKSHSASDFAKGSGSRLSLKVNDAKSSKFDDLRGKTSLNKTQLMKGIILQINDEILQDPKAGKIAEIESVLLASA